MAGLLKRMLLAHVAVLALGACGPTLIPAGYMATSRQNIGEGLPGFIVEGKTTRDEVLMRMGEPDERGHFDRWFGYESRRSMGGVAIGMNAPLLAVGSYTMRYRRIVLNFSDQGVVESAAFAQRECVEQIDPRGITRCVDADLEMVRDRFPGAVYRSGDRWTAGAVDVTNQAVVFWFKPEPGSGNPVLRRLPTETIADVQWGRDDAQQGGPTALVARTDGGIDVFAFRPLAGKDPAEAGAFDTTRTERFIEGVKALQSKQAR